MKSSNELMTEADANDFYFLRSIRVELFDHQNKVR